MPHTRAGACMIVSASFLHACLTVPTRGVAAGSYVFPSGSSTRILSHVAKSSSEALDLRNILVTGSTNTRMKWFHYVTFLKFFVYLLHCFTLITIEPFPAFSREGKKNRERLSPSSLGRAMLLAACQDESHRDSHNSLLRPARMPSVSAFSEACAVSASIICSSCKRSSSTVCSMRICTPSTEPGRIKGYGSRCLSRKPVRCHQTTQIARSSRSRF
jgi:hypothetical protein